METPSVQERTELREDLLDLLKTEIVTDIFAILDEDNSGEVSKKEFRDAVMQTHERGVPLHQLEMLQLARKLLKHLDDLDKRTQALRARVASRAQAPPK